MALSSPAVEISLLPATAYPHVSMQPVAGSHMAQAIEAEAAPEGAYALRRA